MKGIILLAIAMAGIMLLAACSSNSAGRIGEMTLTLSPRTLDIGDNKVDVLIVDSAGNPVTEATVICELVHHSMQMEKDVCPAIHMGEGHYAAIVTPTMSGAWSVFVEVQRDNRSLGRAEFTISIRGGGPPVPHVHG